LIILPNIGCPKEVSGELNTYLAGASLYENPLNGCG